MYLLLFLRFLFARKDNRLEPSIFASSRDEERWTAGKTESLHSRRRRSEYTGATAPRAADNIA